MSFDLIEFMEFNEYVEESIPRRSIIRGPEESPFYDLTDANFRKRYRFSKECVADTIIPLLNNNVTSKRGLPLSCLAKVLIALRFFATGSFQIVAGDLRCVSQPTVSRIIKEVSTQLSYQLNKFVKFPRSDEDLNATKRDFYRIAGFPDVVGCIDCTHIPILSPGGVSAENYRNRKSWMSLNIQVVSGPKFEIFDIIIRWPGSAHDSRIFANSGVRFEFEDNTIRGILLGDNGYPQKRYLFTPLLNPTTPEQIRYNRAHVKTRTVVERLFGVWKRKFACLSRKLSTKLSTTTKIIAACAVLHNISVQRGDNFDSTYYEEQLTSVPTAPVDDRALGRAIRQAFIERHFM